MKPKCKENIKKRAETSKEKDKENRIKLNVICARRKGKKKL